MCKMFENLRRGRQARNFTKNVLKSQIVVRTDIFRKLTLGALILISSSRHVIFFLSIRIVLSCFCLLIFLFWEILDLILAFAVTLPFTVYVKLLSIDKFPEACRSTTRQCFHLILSPHTPKRGAWGQTLAPDPSDRAFKKSKCPQFFGVL